MRLRWRITLVIGLLAVVGLSVAYFWHHDPDTDAVESTRQSIRRQGCKTDLSEFDFSVSQEVSARSAALISADIITAGIQGKDYSRRSVLWQNSPDVMVMVGSDAAVVAWRQEHLTNYFGEDRWDTIRSVLSENEPQIDAACTAIVSGPIGFNLNASQGDYILLSHLGTLRNLSHLFGIQSVLDLHDGNRELAWMHGLASARLVTAWKPERIEASYLTRYTCTATAYDNLWQLLQSTNWSETQLAQLQAEWQSVDFFSGLPETAAFTRAALVAACRSERLRPMMTTSVTATQVLRSPVRAVSDLRFHNNEMRYRETGTFEEEKALLTFYRDRELELRRAIQARTWLQMRGLPGVTNARPYRSKYVSRFSVSLQAKQIGLVMQERGVGLLGLAAEAEARRRLVIAAIALERFRAREGTYPASLAQLVPAFAPNVPIDFMDGKPLRYRLTEGGQFVLYSVGLDCVDNGGKATQPRGRGGGGSEFGIPHGTDLVWPRPATATSIENQRIAEENRIADAQADEEKRAEALRQNVLSQLRLEYQASLRPKHPRLPNPVYQGQVLTKWLNNPNTARTNEPTMDELMTLHQVTTGKEPNVATFEIPIRYDALKAIGSLRLLVDPGPEPTNDVIIASSPEGRAREGGGEFQTCKRNTNGNCLLVWNTTFDPPGQHYLRARLMCTDRQKGWRTFEIKGPLLPFLSTNLCQFNAFYSEFDSRGAILYAKLPEPNGTYSIELKTPAGDHIRTFNGTTTNGIIEILWDLTDDRGNRCTNQWSTLTSGSLAFQISHWWSFIAREFARGL